MPKEETKVSIIAISEIFRGDEILIKEGTKEDRPRTSQIATRKDVRKTENEPKGKHEESKKEELKVKPTILQKKPIEEPKMERGR